MSGTSHDWLRDGKDPRVIAWLKEENARTENVMAETGNLRGPLFRELCGRIEESSRSAALPDGPFVYQSRIEAGEEYPRYFRRPRSGDGPWTLYFDSVAEAAGKAYFDLGFLDVSPDGSTLAYAVDTIGDESYTIAFRDLETGKDLPDRLQEASPEGEWDASGSVYFFLREDSTRRSNRIFRHPLGSDPDHDVCLYTEDDPAFHAGLYKSQDGQFLFAVSESSDTTELHTLPASNPAASFTRLFPRRPSIQYWAEHDQGHWLVRTNEDAPDFQLLRLPVEDPSPAKARVLSPPSPGVRLTDVLPLREHLVLLERVEGLDRIRILNKKDTSGYTLTMPDAVYDLQPSGNAEYDTPWLVCEYSSPIRPPMTVRYHLDTRHSEVLRQAVVPSGHDPAAYTAYRIHAAGHDGTRIPVTVCHRRDLPRDGSAPAYLHGYGAYGETVEAAFRRSWLSWLERGFVVAVAHVRGGGLLGEHWYQAGRLQLKENSFHDFIASAEGLVQEKLTSPGNICIEGGSAGGMLIGVALNRRPELFFAAVASVPFVDCLQSMLDPSLPLTTLEYGEWGDPRDPVVHDRLKGYAPCENVPPSAFPPVLATAALHDTRVSFHEAAKWVSLLRENQSASAPILLHTSLEEGHMGPTGRYEALKDTALEQAFLLQMYHMSREGAVMKSSTV
ncbi:MAG: S9 family peptidase [Oceanipulchritudo sp.]